MSKYLAQFGPEADATDPAPLKRAVIIASSQRCGSSLLGYTLGKTGGFGVPLEYFNQQNLAHWKKRFAVEGFADFLDQVERVRTTSNGVFAIKCHYFQLNEIGSIRNLLLRYDDCRFVAIKRRDLLRQAISRTIAVQTGVWFSGQERQKEPEYNANQITQNIQTLLRQRIQWDTAFAITGVKPLEIYYEDLVEKPTETVLRVAAHCDVDPKDLVFHDEPPIEGQKTSLGAQWAERFNADRCEESEPLLNGYLPPRVALADVARAGLYGFGIRRKAKTKWYRSPNHATVETC